MIIVITNSFLKEDGFFRRLIKAVLKIPSRWIMVQLVFSVILFLAIVVVYRRHTQTSLKIVIEKWMFICYLCLILIYTVFSRPYIGSPAYEFELFASYKKFLAFHDEDILWESLYNIIMFIPFGVLARDILSFRKLLVVALGISFLIEITQYICCIGTFEVDDLFNNTLGAVLGYLVMTLIKLLFRMLYKIKSKWLTDKVRSDDTR